MLKSVVFGIVVINLVAGKFYIIETKSKGKSGHGSSHHMNKILGGHHTKSSAHEEPVEEYGADYADASAGWSSGGSGSSAWKQTTKPAHAWQQTTKPTPEVTIKENCEYSTWSAWKNSGVCGKTSRFRTRQCTRNGVNEDCAFCGEPSSQSEEITLGPCCSWGGWGSWSSPGDRCTDSTVTRSRNCSPIGDSSGGQCTSSDCGTGSSTETKTIPGEICCEWSSWMEGSCSVTCGSGTITKTRNCKDWNGGVCNQCSGESTSTSPCPNLPVCTPVEPVVTGGWGGRRR